MTPWKKPSPISPATGCSQMVISSLFPVFAMIVLGMVLKQNHLTNDNFLKTADRLIYFIFFPTLLFWKIGAASSDLLYNWALCKAAMGAVSVTFLVSTLFLKILNISAYQSGSFSQSCYRFNTYIGVAVIMNAMGETGIRHFGILIGIIIPFINVLSVSILIWFSASDFSGRQRVMHLLKSIISNPLIIGCLAGIAYSRAGIGFPIFLDNAFRLMSMATLPLALISIGGALTLKSLTGNLPVALPASLFKLVLLPVTGWYLLHLFGVDGEQFKVGMLFFALPASPAIYVLSSQFNSDTQLASSTIVLSTGLSFFSLLFVLTRFF